LPGFGVKKNKSYNMEKLKHGGYRKGAGRHKGLPKKSISFKLTIEESNIWTEMYSPNQRSNMLVQFVKDKIKNKVHTNNKTIT
jgi:hypothetical protein